MLGGQRHKADGDNAERFEPVWSDSTCSGAFARASDNGQLETAPGLGEAAPASRASCLAQRHSRPFRMSEYATL